MTLFEDNDFPISGYSKRPHKLVSNPKFFGRSFSSHEEWKQSFERRKEIKGNHAKFFLAAVSSLTKDLNNFLKVIPEQSFERSRYTGRFQFIFFGNNGEPSTIIIDDRLPVSSDELLSYSECVEEVFWYPLLEKAYAKFRGGYDKIQTGLIIESFFHLTGKEADWFDSGAGTSLPYNPNGMYAHLKGFIDERRLLVCKLKNPISNNQDFGSPFTIIEVSEGKRLSNDGIDERRGMVKLRHPSGRIERDLADEMGISEIDSFGEGSMDVEKFLHQMDCVYSVDMTEMPVLKMNSGLDAYVPFVPFIPVAMDSPTNKHRCKH